MQRIYLNSRASSCIHSFRETNYLSRRKVSRPAGSCFRPAESDLRSAGRDLRPTGRDSRPTGRESHPAGRDTGLLTFPRSVLYIINFAIKAKTIKSTDNRTERVAN